MTTAKSNGHLGWNDQVVSHRRRSDVVVVVIVTGHGSATFCDGSYFPADLQ